MMKRTVLALMLALPGAAVLAAEGEGDKQPHPCSVKPVFHCARTLDDGSVIARFGYRGSCPEFDSDKSVVDLYLPIGDDNHFTPEPADRGQPTLFLPGEHLDEFEAEFSAEEIKQGGALAWTVLKSSARVDLSRSADAAVDCSP